MSSEPIKQHRYHIFTSSNKGLVLQIAISITVMAEHLAHDFIDFYLLHSEISAKDIHMLSNLCNTYENTAFHEVRVPDPESYDLFVQAGERVREAYYSLCAHRLLPDTIDRALYIDAGDVLILGNIAPYYTCDFDDNFLIVTAQNINGERTAHPYHTNLMISKKEKNSLTAFLKLLFILEIKSFFPRHLQATSSIMVIRRCVNYSMLLITLVSDTIRILTAGQNRNLKSFILQESLLSPGIRVFRFFQNVSGQTT